MTLGRRRCSAAGQLDSGPAPSGVPGGGLAGQAGLPTFVPPRFRAPLLAAAARWNVSAALLAAQLMAESNFDPFAFSAAGAAGDRPVHPFDRRRLRARRPLRPGGRDRCRGAPDVGPDAPVRLAELALAAYNAGPAAVEACHCVPSIPETQAYVSRILALLGGAGALAAAGLEVRLVA